MTSFTHAIFVPFEWVHCSHIVLFICNVKKIKGAAHKNSDVDGTCKRDLSKFIGNRIKLVAIH